MNNILVNAPMALATQQGIKTQTRRAIDKRYEIQEISELNANGDKNIYPFRIIDNRLLNVYDTHDISGCFKHYLKAPYKIGQVLWVREPAKVTRFVSTKGDRDFNYFNSEFISDGAIAPQIEVDRFKKDGLFPKWLVNCQGIPNGCIKEMARTFIRITNIRVERLNEISEGDAKAEGIDIKSINDLDVAHYMGYTCDAYVGYYDHEYTRSAFAKLWESINGKDSFDNRWVWVIEFELINKEEALNGRA